MRKMCLVLAIIIAINTINGFGVNAASYDLSYNEMIETLVQAGYSKETAEALDGNKLFEIANTLKDNPSAVDVSTSSMEVDFLEEVEAICSYTDEELVEQGANIESIEKSRDDIEQMYEMSNKELEKEYGMDNVEAELFKDAVESGKEILEGEADNEKAEECEVVASGSISSEKLTYTQTVVDISTKKKPKYSVTLSYAWKTAYLLGAYNDEIVVGWGGKLNITSVSGRAQYYDYGAYKRKWKSYVSGKSMDTEETIQAGMEFIFPQSVSGLSREVDAKTKNGYCNFVLYQSKFKGYDTKIISRYCHRVIVIGSGISISASGASVSLNIGTAWDKTSQKTKTIKY